MIVELRFLDVRKAREPTGWQPKRPYTRPMSFYYGSSQPPDDEPPGGLKETLTIILAVFRVLALPWAALIDSSRPAPGEYRRTHSSVA